MRLFTPHIRVHRRGAGALEGSALRLGNGSHVWAMPAGAMLEPRNVPVGTLCVMFQPEHWSGFEVPLAYWRNVPTGTLWKSMKSSFASR
jgi:hypothetical protein